MKYDPNSLPFWEQQRGDGPYTKLRRRREKLGISSKFEGHTNPEPLSDVGNRNGNRWVSRSD